VRNPPPNPGQDTDTALADWGMGADAIARFKQLGQAG
jgi:crotonobetainyl-CoA:carnitine CoA-transferase CaiB-like acyl-CoA transferase